MADRTPQWNENPLRGSDRIRYQEIAPGIFAKVGASVITGGSGANEADVDVTGSLVTIDLVHHEIHEGETFSISYKSPDGAAIADDGTIIFFLTTGLLEAHLIAEGAGGGDAEIELGEGATIGAGGTAMTPVNRHRNMTTISTVAVRRDAAVTGAGTIIENKFIPGGTGGVSVGGIAGQREEWVLASSTIYMLRLTNRAGNAQPMSLEAIWYEENV
jgi:hypothetical protein